VTFILGTAGRRRDDGQAKGGLIMSKPKDINLKHDVEAELEWDPAVDARKIGVAAEGGVATLTGHVHSYAEKWNAERIAKRVHGVQGVANEIEVQLAGSDHLDDADIVQSALSALGWNFSVPKDRIRVMATKGSLTLEGDVEWQFQKHAAEEAVHYLRGVRGVSNQIVVKPHVQAGDVKSKIEAALKRSAEVDSKHVIIETSDGSVTLRGQVRSWAEHDDALGAAWAAPGVTKVVDHLSISA
jgi:osmotically-inducible protein OsmY